MMLSSALNPSSFFRQMDRVLADFTGFSPDARTALGRAPAPINVWEDDHTVTVEAELPGFKLEQVDVSWEKQTLTIHAARQPDDAAPRDAARFLHRERSFGEFSRTLTLNREINADAIAASMTDGVLTIRLPKAPAAQARKVAIVKGSSCA